MRRALMLIALLALAGCGGSSSASKATVPDGFKTLTGTGWTFAYPAAWQVSTVDGARLAQGPKGATGLAPQAAVSRQLKPPPFKTSLDAFKADQTIRRSNWKVTRNEPYKLDGADAAQLIESDYMELTGATTTPVHTIDLLVRTKAGDQLDFLMRAPKADFSRVRLDEVLDTIRLR